MNYVDIILVFIILVSVSHGIREGLISGVLHILGWLCCIIFTLLCYTYVADFIEHYMPIGVWMLPVSFLITLIVIRLLVNAVVSRLLRSVPQSVHESTINRAGGLLPGLFNGLIWAALVSVVLLILPISENLTAATQDSYIAQRLSVQVERLEAYISPRLNEAINRSFTRLTIAPHTDSTITLPYKVDKWKVRKDLEAEMLDMINEERMKQHLHQLKADTLLAAVARQHDADMFRKGYFSHISPEGKTPYDRIRDAHIQFLTAGENLAVAPTLQMAHKGLMNSPDHRANILNPSFGSVGIGIIDGGIHGLMITQEFKN